MPPSPPPAADEDFVPLDTRATVLVVVRTTRFRRAAPVPSLQLDSSAAGFIRGRQRKPPGAGRFIVLEIGMIGQISEPKGSIGEQQSNSTLSSLCMMKVFRCFGRVSSA